MNFKLILGLAIVIAALSITLARVIQNYNRLKEEKANVQAFYSDKIKEVEVYKNRFGQTVAKNEALTLENKTIKELVKDGALKELKQLEGLNKRMNNLEFVYKITARALDSVRIRLQDTTRLVVDSNGDSVYYRSTGFKYSDKWASFRAVQYSPDSITLKYSVTVPLTGAMFWKRKHPILWIFSKKEYFGEITSENPHVVIPELLNIKVGKRSK